MASYPVRGVYGALVGLSPLCHLRRSSKPFLKMGLRNFTFCLLPVELPSILDHRGFRGEESSLLESAVSICSVSKKPSHAGRSLSIGQGAPSISGDLLIETAENGTLSRFCRHLQVSDARAIGVASAECP